MKQNKRIFIALIAVFVICTSILLTKICTNSSNNIVIGAKNETENQILAEILAQLIENKTDLSVERKMHMEGTYLCFESLLAGDIDLYPEYTGTALFCILKEKKPSLDFQYIKESFLKKFQITWLLPFGFSNGYTLLANKEIASKYKITNISELCDLLKKNKKIKLAFEAEFRSRIEFLLLNQIYQLLEQGVDSKQMDQSLLLFALQNQSIDICAANETDGRIDDESMKVIQDDKKAFPSYDAAPIIRKETQIKYPFLKNIINQLAGKITIKKMRQMNIDAEKNKRSSYDIAKDFLVKEGLL